MLTGQWLVPFRSTGISLDREPSNKSYVGGTLIIKLATRWFLLKGVSSSPQGDNAPCHHTVISHSGLLNHRQLYGLFNSLFNITVKENRSPAFPMDSPHKGSVKRKDPAPQGASNSESVSMPWRGHTHGVGVISHDRAYNRYQSGPTLITSINIGSLYGNTLNAAGGECPIGNYYKSRPVKSRQQHQFVTSDFNPRNGETEIFRDN